MIAAGTMRILAEDFGFRAETYEENPVVRARFTFYDAEGNEVRSDDVRILPSDVELRVTRAGFIQEQHYRFMRKAGEKFIDAIATQAKAIRAKGK